MLYKQPTTMSVVYCKVKLPIQSFAESITRLIQGCGDTQEAVR